tara:strand:- start:364 stop:516 length:153 start_codon:yes stop_codon:yes gene_type:complete
VLDVEDDVEDDVEEDVEEDVDEDVDEDDEDFCFLDEFVLVLIAVIAAVAG